MKKQIVILLLLVSNALIAFAGGTEESRDDSSKVYKLTLGHIQPTSHANHLGADEFKRMVEAETNGKVTVTILPDNQAGKEDALFDALAMGAGGGTADIAIIGFGEPAKQYSPFLLFDAPYVAKNREHMMRIMNSEVMDGLFDEMRLATGVRAIGAAYYGTRHLTTSDKAVRNPDDISGLKIRVPDQEMYLATLNNMGANATPVAFAEVYLSLQQGVIDGQENPAATIAAKKFYEVQNYLNKTGHIIGLQAIYISDTVFSGLPAEYQKVVLEAGKAAAEWITDDQFKKEDEFLGTIRDNGVTIVEDVDVEAFMARAKELHANYESRWGADLLGKIRSVD